MCFEGTSEVASTGEGSPGEKTNNSYSAAHACIDLYSS